MIEVVSNMNKNIIKRNRSLKIAIRADIKMMTKNMTIKNMVITCIADLVMRIDFRVQLGIIMEINTRVLIDMIMAIDIKVQLDTIMATGTRVQLDTIVEIDSEATIDWEKIILEINHRNSR